MPGFQPGIPHLAWNFRLWIQLFSTLNLLLGILLYTEEVYPKARIPPLPIGPSDTLRPLFT